MMRLDPQVVLAIHEERLPRDLDARVALARSHRTAGRPNPLRRLLGRTLVAAGTWLAAESPPRVARPS